MSKFYLAPHVHACQTDDGITFLDLKKNQYIGLGAAQAAAVARCIAGLPPHEFIESEAPRPTDAEVAEILSEMQAVGLLTTPCSEAHEAKVAPLATAVQSVLEDLLTEPEGTSIRALFRFLRAYLTVQSLLKLGSVAAVVNRIERRKAKGRAHVEPAKIVRLAADFWHLRPLLYTAREKCLLDSLVLAEFLSYYGQFPHVAIGVATAPFRAHCWVQHESLVVNDSTARVDRYTPILVI